MSSYNETNIHLRVLVPKVLDFVFVTKIEKLKELELFRQVLQ